MAYDSTVDLNENSPYDTSVGTVSAYDPDTPMGLTFSITGGNDGETFKIDASSGAISVLTPPNYEAQDRYDLTVNVSDGSASDTATFTINIRDLNEAPVLTPATFEVDENCPDGTSVGTVSATDQDANTTLTYSFANGNGNGAFTIVQTTGEILVPHGSLIDYETTPSYSLQVTVSDGILSDTRTVTINVLDANDPPQPMVQLFSVSDGIILDTTGTSDPDGDTLEFEWIVEDIVLPMHEPQLAINGHELSVLRQIYGDAISITLNVSDGIATSSADASLSFAPNPNGEQFGGCDTGDAPPANWADWAGARTVLNISGSTSPRFVRTAMELLETDYALTTIPRSEPGQTGDAAIVITSDFSDTILGPGTGVAVPFPHATDAKLARLNIRANLKSIKTTLVNQVYNMLLNSPPIVTDRPPLTNVQRIDIANEIADAYITSVDTFLKVHWGAAASLGQRNPILNALGLENAISSPWCADWAEGMLSSMQNKVSNETQLYVLMAGCQWNENLDSDYHDLGYHQHNWMAIYCQGYQVKTKTGNDLHGKPVLFLDPWINIQPEAMLPANHLKMTNWDFVP